MKQINKLSRDGIKMVDGRVVKVNLFEYHDLVVICSLVCNNIISPMGNNFFPWCTCHKKVIHMVTNEIKIEEGDTICIVSECDALSIELLLVIYANLLDVLKFLFIYWHYFLNLNMFLSVRGWIPLRNQEKDGNKFRWAYYNHSTNLIW